MSDIATKLQYLNETKSQLKDTINYATSNEITSSTTFRQYPRKLYNSFIEIINTRAEALFEKLPKILGSGSSVTLNNTQECKVKIEPLGKSSQETISGKQLLDLKDGTYSKEGITVVIKEGELTLNGTATANAFINLQVNTAPSVNVSQTYIISANNTVANSNIRFRVGYTGEYDVILTEQNAKYTFTYSSSVPITSETILVRVGSGATLNDFKIKPMLEVGNVAHDFEPYTGRVPAPNPYYACPIKDVTGDNTISITNSDNTKTQSYPLSLGVTNLFDVDNLSFQNAYISSTGGITSSDQNGLFDFIEVKPNKTYTTSLSDIFAVISINEFNENKSFIKRTQINSTLQNTITTALNTKYVRISLNKDNSTTMTRALIKTYKPQLEEGTHISSYSPYGQEPVYLKGIGDYKDSIVGSPDNWQIKRVIKTVDLGDYNWIVIEDDPTIGTTQVVCMTFDITDIVNYEPSETVYPDLLSNKLRVTPNLKMVSENYDDYAISASYEPEGDTSNDNVIYIQNSDFSGYTRAKVKNALKGTLLSYPLKVPTYETITNETLIKQLNELYYAYSYEGQTNVFVTSSGEQMEVNLEAIQKYE